MLTDKKVDRILTPILVIVLIYAFFKTIKSGENESKLLSKNNYVVGTIIDHRISGIQENFYVEYEYLVNNERYTKTEYYRDRFRDCHETRKCIGLKYIVFYEAEKTENAFMDFNLTELGMKNKNMKLKSIKHRFEKLKVD